MYNVEVTNYNARTVAILKDNTLVKYNNNVVNCGSFEAMKKYMKLNGFTNPRDYELAIQFTNSKSEIEYIKYSDLQQVGEKLYQGYSTVTNEMVQFHFITTKKITSLRYLVFDNGDKVMLDISKASNDKSKQLMTVVRQAINKLMRTTNYIDKYCIDKYSKHTKIDIKGTQESIHICHNFQLVNMNLARKENGMRCLPYIHTMDRFLTIYIYSSTEYVPGLEFKEKYKEFLDKLLETISDIYNSGEVKYEEVELFYGNLYI